MSHCVYLLHTNIQITKMAWIKQPRSSWHCRLAVNILSWTWVGSQTCAMNAVWKLHCLEYVILTECFSKKFLWKWLALRDKHKRCFLQEGFFSRWYFNQKDVYSMHSFLTDPVDNYLRISEAVWQRLWGLLMSLKSKPMNAATCLTVAAAFKPYSKWQSTYLIMVQPTIHVFWCYTAM